MHDNALLVKLWGMPQFYYKAISERKDKEAANSLMFSNENFML